MKEKKKFVLVVPTVVIVLAIAGILMIFYNRNLKDMSREDAKSLAQKVAIIENISCEIVTESNEIEQGQYVVDYKLKDNKMVYRTDYYTIYDNSDKNTKIQIDDHEKIAYLYNDYKSEILTFKEMLCTVEKMLESNEYNYEFVGYETMNGIKCTNFNLSKEDSTFNVWLDRENGMIVKIECYYHVLNSEKIKKVMYYRYKIGNVIDEDVASPDLTGYSTIQL